MAEIKSFPNNQDVYVGAEWVMKWLHGRTSGVFGAENNLAVSVVPDSMSVQVSDGTGWLSNANGDGIVFWNDREQTSGNKLVLNHDVADGVLDRIDRIVVTWETTNYVALPTISILKGTASSSPTAPALTNNSTQRQISLAKVSIPAGTVSLSASMITDERLDPSVCGIVTESISIDTSTMQNQFEALLKAIQNELQELNAGTAALLKTGDTMQGTLDMGGNKIQNVAAPEKESDAVNKKFVDDALANFESGMTTELLWQNASPGSNFSAQTVSLDLSEYDEIEVVYNHATTATFEVRSRSAVPGMAWGLSIVGYAYKRLATAKTTGVEFSDCNYFPSYGNTSDSDANNAVIPYRIYGIKGVK